MNPGDNMLTDEAFRAEAVLRMHGIPGEKETLAQGPRPKAKINAIIRDIRAANAEARDEA